MPSRDRSGTTGEGDPFRLPRTRRRTNGRRGTRLERVTIQGRREHRRADLSPSAPAIAERGELVPAEPDPLGKMALYSGETHAPAWGTVVVECSSCKRETPLTPVQFVRAAFPMSLHLPLLRRFSSYMRCPSCGRWTWLRVTWKV